MKGRLLALFILLCIGISLMIPTALAADAVYSDVAADAWYAEAVAYCQEAGLMSGTSETSFSPNGTASRAMLAAILWRREGSPVVNYLMRFPDVPSEEWYTEAVRWAASKQLMAGYGDGRFGAGESVTREDLAVILWRSAGEPAPETSSDFADQNQIAPYAADAVLWARNEGIIMGKDGNRFDPKATATRAELAMILYRWLGTTKNEEEIVMPKLHIEIGGQIFTATLADNPAARALVERLPLTLSMSELNGNEKYFYLDGSLPANASRPGQIKAGDLMLFGSDCLVLFYESFSTSYSYTPLGQVDNPTGLASALGSGSVEVTFRAD